MSQQQAVSSARAPRNKSRNTPKDWQPKRLREETAIAAAVRDKEIEVFESRFIHHDKRVRQGFLLIGRELQHDSLGFVLPHLCGVEEVQFLLRGGERQEAICSRRNVADRKLPVAMGLHGAK